MKQNSRLSDPQLNDWWAWWNRAGHTLDRTICVRINSPIHLNSSDPKSNTGKGAISPMSHLVSFYRNSSVV